MRERHGILFLFSAFPGITPARAGKTSLHFILIRSSRDHPRSYGKDRRPAELWTCVLGSPPLVRERQFDKAYKRFHIRITPARAGKTSTSSIHLWTSQDHPRSCGKDHRKISSSRHNLGSPPLVRERRQVHQLPTLHHRITPARAGKTATTCPPLRRVRDHPRSCGKD